jgi:hypothetical protein
MSYEALIAAQAKRLSKKRERNWRDDWRADTRTSREKYPNALEGAHDPAEMWMVMGHPAPRTYADLYVPPAPETVSVTIPGFSQPVHVREELSHTEWASGYRAWHAYRDKSLVPRCFAENEI